MKVLSLLVIAIIVVGVPLAYALPAPIKFQRSIPYTVFNSTSATVYEGVLYLHLLRYLFLITLPIALQVLRVQ